MQENLETVEMKEKEESLNSSGESEDRFHWSLSSSSHHHDTSTSTRHKSERHSCSVGASTSIRKVSFAESTPLVAETSTVIFSYSNPRKTSTAFIRERPLQVSIKDWSVSVFSRISMSVQQFGEQTLSMAQHRAVFQSLSLPDIPSLDRRASPALTVINVLGMTYGISTLTFPFIIAKAGIAGLLSIILLGVISCITSRLIVDCQYVTSKSAPKIPKKRIYSNFIEVGAAALPKKIGPSFMKAITFTSLLSDVYVFILLGQSTEQLSRAYLPSLTYQHWILIWVCLLLPLLNITRVSLLAWISFASLLLFVVVVIVMYGLLFSVTDMWDIEHIPLSFSWEYFLIGYGIILNSYNLHWTVPAIEASLTKPESFSATLATAFTINIALKALFGVIGVVTFGAFVEQNVIENLSISRTILTVTAVCVILSQFFYFPMGLFVVFEMIDIYFLPHFPIFQGSKIKKVFWLILSRLLILLCVVFLAVSFSNFGLVVSVIGSLRGTLVAVILPCAAHLKLKWRQLHPLVKVLEVGLMLLCTVLGLGGAYFSARGIAVGSG